MIINTKKINWNYCFRAIMGGLFIFLAIVISFQVLVLMILSLLGIFLSLLKIYPTLDINFKFIGGCFFLVIYWYIFSAVAIWVIKLFKFGMRFPYKLDKKRGKK